MQIVCGDNLHEISKPIFLGKEVKFCQNAVCWMFTLSVFSLSKEYTIIMIKLCIS